MPPRKQDAFSRPFYPQARNHKMPLQPLSNLQLHAIQRRRASLHLQGHRRLDPSLSSDGCHVDRPARHLQKRPHRVQYYVDLFLVEVRTVRHGLDDFLNFGDSLHQLPLESHFHRLRRAGAGTAFALQLQPDDGTIYLADCNISPILKQVRTHFVQHQIDILPRQIQLFVVGGERRVGRRGHGLVGRRVAVGCIVKGRHDGHPQRSDRTSHVAIVIFSY
mmetsp:Transcript_53564/g.113766  ORF Transcript_53564/g.113766 Transcript_53564/m.113766 type:complete len:219 (+) Transcript_53564:314-970(+)